MVRELLVKLPYFCGMDNEEYYSEILGNMYDGEKEGKILQYKDGESFATRGAPLFDLLAPHCKQNQYIKFYYIKGLIELKYKLHEEAEKGIKADNIKDLKTKLLAIENTEEVAEIMNIASVESVTAEDASVW